MWITLTSEIILVHSHIQFSLLFCKSGRDIIVISDYGEGNGGGSGRSEDLSKVIAAPHIWIHVLKTGHLTPAEERFPSQLPSFCVSHDVFSKLSLIPLASFFRVNNFLEVARSGCSISDETCPGPYILLFVHPTMPGRTGFGLSSVLDVLCENDQIVFSL